MTGPEEVAERQRREEIVFSVQNRIRTGLPQFTSIDRGEFDAYDRSKDTRDRGQVLTFFMDQERAAGSPSLMFIFRGPNFTLNYYNSPEPTTSYSHRHENNSLYGRRQKSWTIEELDYALERAQIHMQGIEIESGEFQNQLVGWHEKEQRFMTMQERLNLRDEYVKAEEPFKKRMRREWQLSILDTVWNIYDKTPERAKELAIARIMTNPTYTTFQGAQLPSEEVIKQIKENAASGEQAVLREMYKIESYERLLKDHNLL